jgi:hypothetical protein
LNETLLTVSLVGVALYFSVLIVRGALRYATFQKVRRRALLTWPGPRPAYFSLLVAMGGVAAVVAVLNGYLRYPFHKIYSQLSIAVYFMGVVPLLTRIPKGLYDEGIWAEDGFIPYDRIERLAFREGPELLLLLVPRGGGGARRLTVPPGEYGAVRRILGDKIRAHALNLEGSILGL